jgi:hypothetical protein
MKMSENETSEVVIKKVNNLIKSATSGKVRKSMSLKKQHTKTNKKNDESTKELNASSTKDTKVQLINISRMRDKSAVLKNVKFKNELVHVVEVESYKEFYLEEETKKETVKTVETVHKPRLPPVNKPKIVINRDGTNSFKESCLPCKCMIF